MKPFSIIPVIICIGVGVLSAKAQKMPGSYKSLPQVDQHNFIREYTVLQPSLNGLQIIDPAANPQKVQLTTQYFDGLGRPIQTVVRKGSLNSSVANSTPMDLVSVQSYNSLGLEDLKFLPFVSGVADGSFNGVADPTAVNNTNPTYNPFARQSAFYLGANSPIANQGETFFYSQSNFENSPLNRVEETFAPGNSWVGTWQATTPQNRRSVKTQVFLNTVLDEVRIWNVVNNGSGLFSSYASPAAYLPGKLIKTITTDENNNQSIEFKDNEGKVILKKIQLTANADNGSGANHTGWICTYYLYDDEGGLRCVVQPEGVKWLSNNNWNFSATDGTTVLAEQCFRYEYDQRDRMMSKKVPGAAEVLMVYDNRDRLVLTQDGNMRLNNQWLYTWYDELNRPIATGLWTTTTTVATLRSQAAAIPGTSYGYFPATAQDELTRTDYNDYTRLSTYPGHSLTAGYYPETGFSAEDNTTFPYARAQAASSLTKGLPTITRTRILGTSHWITTVMLYDAYGRVLQTKVHNALQGSTETTTVQYGFAGQPMRTVQRQELSSAGGNAQTLVLVTSNQFDELGRVKSIQKQQGHTAINSGSLSTPKTIATIQYDALGQVKTRKLGTKPGSTDPLETLTMDYNIRGWLLGMNRNFVTNPNSGAPEAGKWFGFDLGYDKLSNAASNNYLAAQYNGNISGQSWRSAGDNAGRQYRYSYDAANRLLKADFVQRRSTEGSYTKSFNYDSYMGDGSTPASAYDLNGNILRMQQWGWTAGSTNTYIDNLTYTYQNNGLSNRLRAVTDNQTPPADLGDFTNKNTTADDYGYDVNGNLITDLNKRLNGSIGSNLASGGAITYNHLNLPASIAVKKDDGTAKGSITYTYDAAGQKLRKVTTETGVTIGATSNITITTTTNYIGGCVYESKSYSPVPASYASYSNQLQFAPHEEGRIRAVRATPNSNPTALEYDYMLKDHLGNVRMVLTEEVKVDDYPTATMEDVYAATETAVYTGINSTTRANRHPNMPADGSTSPNSRAALLGSTTQRIGPGILLKVQAGDQIELWCRSWWQGSMSGQTNSNQTAIRDGLATLLGSLMPGTSGGKISSSQTGTNGSYFAPALLSFLQANNPEQSTKPKAYLNWVFLDEQFTYQANNGSGAEAVDASNVYKLHERKISNSNALVAKQSGYVYIYTSNESSLSVYFDNMKVKHVKSALLEETHYYPFGLTMAGISSKAAGILENKKLFNKGSELQNEEFSDDSGLKWYDVMARTYDPELGRFMQVDPIPDDGDQESYSIYQYSLLNPLRYNDPDGKCPTCKTQAQKANAKMESLKRATDKLNEANNNLKSAFSGSATLKAKAWGIGFVGKAGPIKLNGEVNLITGGGGVENKMVKVNGTWIQAKGAAKLGSNKAAGSIDILKGEAKYDVQTNKLSFNGKLFDAKGEAQRGNISLSNSLELGLGGKLGPVSLEGSVDLYKIGKAVVNYAEAGVEYTLGKIAEILPF